MYVLPKSITVREMRMLALANKRFVLSVFFLKKRKQGKMLQRNFKKRIPPRSGFVCRFKNSGAMVPGFRSGSGV
jgi:hypothetical protein